MSGNYPAGVTDNDPYFDLPNAHEDEDDPFRVCLKCGHEGSALSNGRCLYGYVPPDGNPGCGCSCEFAPLAEKER